MTNLQPASLPDYETFLRSKALVARSAGFEVSTSKLNPHLFDWQKAVTQWALRKGHAAIFAGCGLGKTLMELEYARQIQQHTRGDVLVLAPLAVAEQTRREGEKFGIPVNVCRSQADARAGINVTNYEMLDKFDPQAFTGVVVDESSLLKNHTGAMRKMITEAFANTPFRLAATATPAPNDYMELGTHAEFLGVMKRNEMLSMFFTHDGGDTSKWRLKGHAEQAYMKWLCSWSLMIQRPSDIGYSDAGYDLPPLLRHQHVVKLDKNVDGFLFTPDKLTLEERRDVRRNSLDARVAKCAELVNGSREQWLVWCDLNDESAALAKAIPGAVEVTGSHPREYKEQAALDFIEGRSRVVISKGSIWGWGMNFQNCHNAALVGLSDSFEQIYQIERRCWRFGQTKPVNVHVVISDGDGPVVRNIERKEEQFGRMITGMVGHMKEEMRRELGVAPEPTAEQVIGERAGNGWKMLHGDCVERTAAMGDESIDFTVFSPPFSSLYTYSNSDRDMGNSASDDQFKAHFGYLVDQLYRVTQPGRIVAFHCMNVPAMKERDGYIGIKDFRGDLIREFQQRGFIFHSEHTIWKDPLIEATRTKAIGLMHKQLTKDSSMSRAGLPDYLIAMRKPGENKRPIPHEQGLTQFFGEDAPKGGVLSHERWRRYASPVWMDIDQGDTLNARMAREDADERHICPLQLQVIERAIELWSRKGDTVLDPFAGIGSTGYVAIQRDRRFIGIELKESYFNRACLNVGQAERAGREQHDLFAQYERPAERMEARSVEMSR